MTISVPLFSNLRIPVTTEHREIFDEIDDVLSRKSAHDLETSRPLFAEIDIGRGDQVAFYQAMLSFQRYGFPLQINQMPAAVISRCASMLSGPFFCSERYPWPDQSTGTVEPIIQLDLVFASEVAGGEIGSGLVQAWGRDGECWTRFIPQEDVREELLTAPPTDARLNFGASGGNLHAWSALEEQTATWLSAGYQITGTDAPQISLNGLILDTLILELIDRRSEYPTKLVARAEALADQLDGCSMYYTDYLFGNFNSRQYGPYLEPLLANLDEEIFRWGDEGSAKLSFVLGDKEDRYEFEWISG